MRAKLLTNLTAYLLNFTPDDEAAPIFLHADLWNNQLEFIEEEIPFPTPAVFLELLPTNWSQKNNTTQESDIRINFHLVHSDPLAALKLCDLLHFALARFRSDTTARPIRESSTPDHNHSELCDFVEQYRIKLEDTSASKEAKELLLNLKITKS
jgi:hypothetical protein